MASDANMVEEEGEDLFGGKYPSHRDLWVQFAKGLGIARDDILNYEPLPVIRAALEMYYRLYSKVIGQLPSARGSYSKGPAQADERGTRSVREILPVDSNSQFCLEEKLQNQMREAVKSKGDWNSGSNPTHCAWIRSLERL